MGGAWEWPSKPGRGFSRLGGTSARRRGAFLWSAQLTLFGSENRRPFFGCPKLSGSCCPLTGWRYYTNFVLGLAVLTSL